MKKTIEHYISELLFLHDCVIIPGFGGFVGNKTSAKLNKTTGTLTPPSKQILFNKNLKTNDGLLVSHIAHQEGIEQKEASNNLEVFSNKCRSKLDDTKILRLDKIGLFTVEKDGNIIFLQDSSSNYNLDSFGMNPTYNKAVVRKMEEKAESKRKKIGNNLENTQFFLRAAAVIIPLVALSYLSISQEERINTLYMQMATFNPFAPKNINNTNAEITPLKSTTPIKTKGEVRYENTPVKDNDLKIILPQQTYYIIAGAFAEEKNAIRMYNKLNSWNYNSEILTESNLLRVSYNSFKDKQTAILALNKIKLDNPDAWLLTK